MVSSSKIKMRISKDSHLDLENRTSTTSTSPRILDSLDSLKSQRIQMAICRCRDFSCKIRPRPSWRKVTTKMMKTWTARGSNLYLSRIRISFQSSTKTSCCSCSLQSWLTTLPEFQPKTAITFQVTFKPNRSRSSPNNQSCSKNARTPQLNRPSSQNSR